MTRQEMTKLFALMMLAWPKAEMFQRDKMKPTIALWAACLPEVDFLTGQAATIRLCRECKFPPTIAEMREAAENVRKEISRKVSHSRYVAEVMGVFCDGYTPHKFMEERRRELLGEMAEEMRQLPSPNERNPSL